RARRGRHHRAGGGAVRFWDSSAVVSLLTKDVPVPLAPLARDGVGLSTWWGGRVECHSALRRQAREGRIAAGALPRPLADVDRLPARSHEVLPSDPLRALACELVDRHPLRAGDALQLAAAVTERSRSNFRMEFVCLDRRLRRAAVREGFAVLPA